MTEIGNSPAGVIEAIPNLAYRQRSVYWRPVKNKAGETIDWMPTLPLPSDVQGQAQYLAKGFKLADPRIQQETMVIDADKAKMPDELYAEIARLMKENAELKTVTKHPGGRPKKTQ